MRIANSKCQTTVIHAGHVRKRKRQNSDPVVDIGKRRHAYALNLPQFISRLIMLMICIQADSDWGCFRGCAISSNLGAPLLESFQKRVLNIGIKCRSQYTHTDVCRS